MTRRERTLRWGCVEADVSIMFPWNMPRFESLKAQHRNTGDVDVWFGQNGNTSHLEVDFAVDGLLSNKHGYNNNNNKYNCNVGAGRASLPPPEAPRVVFDRLDIKTNKGFVYLTNTHVSEELKVVSEQNAVVGQVTANKLIEIESKLHTTLSLISSNASDLLMVSAETVAQVSMVKETNMSLLFFSFIY